MNKQNGYKQAQVSWECRYYCSWRKTASIKEPLSIEIDYFDDISPTDAEVDQIIKEAEEIFQ